MAYQGFIDAIHGFLTQLRQPVDSVCRLYGPGDEGGGSAPLQCRILREATIRAQRVQGKRVTARGIVSFVGEGGEFIVVLFLTEDSGVPPATTSATPPTCLLYLPPHLLNSWLATLQIAPPTMGSIDFDDPEQTFVGPLPS